MELQNYYYKQPEPFQSCLLALRDIILGMNGQIVHKRKYQIPFFLYKEKSLGFLWVHRKKIVIGFLTDKSLISDELHIRKKDKIETMVLNPNEDIPVDEILNNYNRLIGLYDSLQ